jgi:hypothetical protein
MINSSDRWNYGLNKAHLSTHAKKNINRRKRKEGSQQNKTNTKPCPRKVTSVSLGGGPSRVPATELALCLNCWEKAEPRN